MFKGKKFKLKKELPPRELSVINQEFVNECAQAGSCQYQIEQLTIDLDSLNYEIRKLSKEEQTPEVKANADKAFVNAGSCYYQITILQGDLERLTKSIRALNNEAFRRKQLDGEKKEAV